VFSTLPDLLASLAAPPPPVDWVTWAEVFQDAVDKIMAALFSVYDSRAGEGGAIVLAKDLAPQIEAILGVFETLTSMLQAVAELEGKIPSLEGFGDAFKMGSIPSWTHERDTRPSGDTERSKLVLKASGMSEVVTRVLGLSSRPSRRGGDGRLPAMRFCRADEDVRENL